MDDDDDAVRPSKETFNRVLSNSHRLWSSYLTDGNPAPLLPSSCIDLKRIIGRTPSFLGYGLPSDNERVPFTCVGKEDGLLATGRSVWTVSHAPCHLESRTIPLDILLGVSTPLTVHISNSAPLAKWPGIDSFSDHAEGNYLAVLFLAWAYILSARWAGSLEHSSEHRCKSIFKEDTNRAMMPPDQQQHKVEVDIGNDVDADEAGWWQAILSSTKRWEITTEYHRKTYLSPWSVSLSDAVNIGVVGAPLPNDTSTEPPSSDTALMYLARFCSRYHLDAQCSAALAAALYIPFLGGGSVSLPLPRHALRDHPSTVSSAQSSNPVTEHGKFLSYYMTLSCNVWGMRSLLCSTFFNPQIECNLVSAWLNPAFVILDRLVQEDNQLMLVNVLARRQPRLGGLWLGAVLMGVAKSVLQGIRIGLTALELNAAGWTGIEQSFITGKPGISDGMTIRREDECRLLFITGCDRYARPPVYPWKPFGETQLYDADLSMQQHACCNCHFLDYRSWEWNLTTGEVLEDPGMDTIASAETDPIMHKPENPLIRCNYEYPSQPASEVASEAATRGIFGWLRSTGYPANEKAIYEHSWIDIEESEEEEDDAESDMSKGIDDSAFIDEWVRGVINECRYMGGRMYQSVNVA